MRSLEEITEATKQAYAITDLDAIRSLAEEALTLGTTAAQAKADNLLGGYWLYRGEYARSREHFERSIALYGELGEQLEAAWAIGNLGNVHCLTSDFPRALECFDRAIDVLDRFDNQAGLAMHRMNRGNVFLQVADYPRAMEDYQHSLAGYQELDNAPGIADSTSSLGSVYFRTGDHLKALELFERSLAAYRKIGNEAGVVYALNLVISALVQLDRLDEADAFVHEMTTLTIVDPQIQTWFHGHRATLRERRGDLEGALEDLRRALEIAESIGLKADSALLYKHLRDLAQKRNDFEGYITYNTRFTELNEEVRGKEATQKLAIMEAEKNMILERQEREKERALLYGALPEHIATRMLAGKIIEDHFEHAAVMFTDITGFTTHTSSMHPSETIKLLEDLYNTFDAICAEHGVTTVKTIGDSYLCFAHESGEGLSADRLEAAQRVANVALKMLTSGHAWPDGSPLQLRIGIHSGPLSAGVIGTQRLQYDIWGDTVNVASRMESTAEPGRIQVSAEFHEQLSSRVPPLTLERGASEGGGVRFLTIERGSVDIKGKGFMTTYWLEGA